MKVYTIVSFLDINGGLIQKEVGSYTSRKETLFHLNRLLKQEKQRRKAIFCNHIDYEIHTSIKREQDGKMKESELQQFDLSAEYPIESSADFIDLDENIEKQIDIKGRKYLSDIGLKEEDLYFLGEAKNDSRYRLFREQREMYGFDERETWNLDIVFFVWLYERLMMYNELNIINTDYHKIEYKGEEYTFQECIDIMLSEIKDILTGKCDDEFYYGKNVVELLSKCFNLLWW